MRELLQKISRRLDGGAYVNEAAVRIGIIEPILASLGWETTDPLTVIPEYSSEGRRVDYALCSFPARPSVFIEAKAVGKVEAADKQLFEYAFHGGVPFAILTDGRTWSFYLPSAQGSYEERRLHKLDLQERSPDECERIFIRYLAYQRHRSGEAHADAQKDHASRANERVASDTLHRAWAELISEPDPLLIELLVDRTEALCGIRPSLETAEAHLLGRPNVQSFPITQPKAPQALRAVERDAPTVPLAQVKPSPRRLIAKFRGNTVDARDATSAFLALMRILATEFPERLEQIATAAKGRSRNHIARASGDVYPDRADLIHTVVELVPGWFVGTNIANREKHRIVKAACGASGVQFGSELVFEIPNS